jgi:hypothetical protein
VTNSERGEERRGEERKKTEFSTRFSYSSSTFGYTNAMTDGVEVFKCTDKEFHIDMKLQCYRI